MSNDVKDQEVPHCTAELLDRYMRDLGADEQAVRACLESAGEAELKRYGFDYYFINFLSIFEDRLPLEDVRALAARATVAKLWGGWEYYSYLTRLPEKADDDVKSHGTPVRLGGWDAGLIRGLLDEGNGLIICSHHLGAYRYLQTDLVFLGLKVAMPVDGESYEQTVGAVDLARKALRESPSADPALTEMLESLTPVNVEERRGAAEILKTLERGEVILIFADGNTGVDGPLGKKSRSEVDFFNFRISVKSGAARMSAATSAPLLPVLALAGGKGAMRVVSSGPIIPPPKSSGRAERDAFVRSAMQSIYGLLEQHARRDPEHWQSSCFLHRWRAAAQQDDSPPVDIPAERRDVARLLESGARLKLNGNRVAAIDTEDGRVLVDVRELKFYGNLKWAEDLLRALTEPGGLRHGWLNSRGDDLSLKDKYLDLLAHFKRTGLLQSPAP